MALDGRRCVLVVGVMLVLSGVLQAQPPKDGPPMPKGGKPGVSVNDVKAFKGYTLVAPMNSTKAYLIDMEGRVVHTWECKDTTALSTYDGKLETIMNEEQRTAFKKLRERGGPGFGGPFVAGGGFGGFPGGYGPGGLFGSYRYGVDHPAFQGKTLTPGKKIEEL